MGTLEKKKEVSSDSIILSWQKSKSLLIISIYYNYFKLFDKNPIKVWLCRYYYRIVFFIESPDSKFNIISIHKYNIPSSLTIFHFHSVNIHNLPKEREKTNKREDEDGMQWG